MKNMKTKILYLNSINLRSRIYIVQLVLCWVAIIVSLYLYGTYKSVTEFSLINDLKLIVTPVITTITIAIAVTTWNVFGATRFSNEDTYFYAKTLSRKVINYLKYLSILILIMVQFASFLFIGSIFMLTWNLNLKFIIQVIGWFIPGGALYAICLIPIFAFIFLYFKPQYSFAISILPISLVVVSALAPIFANKQVRADLTYDKTLNQNNYFKIINVDNKGEVLKVTNGIEIVSENSFNTSINLSDKKNSGKYDFSKTLTSPFDMFLSKYIKPTLSSENYIELNNYSDKWSYSEYKLNIMERKDTINNENVFMVPYNIVSPLELSSEELVEQVLKVLSNIPNEDSTEYDWNYWTTFLTKLKRSDIWIGQLTTKQVDIIKFLVGQDQNSLLLWYLIEQWNFLDHNKIKLKESIAQEISAEFWEFLDFIWFSNIAYSNINISEELIQPQEMKNYLPSNTRFNNYKNALSADVNYIKDILVSIDEDDQGNMTTFNVLNREGVYVEIPDIASVLSKNIYSRADWEKLINLNKQVVNLSAIVEKLDVAIGGEMANFIFRDNEFLDDSINEVFEIDIVNSEGMVGFQFAILTTLVSFLHSLVARKINRKDLK